MQQAPSDDAAGSIKWNGSAAEPAPRIYPGWIASKRDACKPAGGGFFFFFFFFFSRGAAQPILFMGGLNNFIDNKIVPCFLRWVGGWPKAGIGEGFSQAAAAQAAERSQMGCHWE